MSQHENEEPPRQEPFADAPCDAPDNCSKPWTERVEWTDANGKTQVRYACARHAKLYLMSTAPPPSKN